MFLDVTHYPAQDLQDLYTERLLYFTNEGASNPRLFSAPAVTSPEPFWDFRRATRGQRFYLNIED